MLSERVFRQTPVQNPSLQTRIDPVKPRLQRKLQSFSLSDYLFFILSLDNDADNRSITATGFNIEVIFINTAIINTTLTEIL